MGIYPIGDNNLLLFIVYKDFFSTGIAGALGTVRDHIDNDSLDLSTAISLIGEISSTELSDDLNSLTVEQDTEVLTIIIL